MSRLPTLKSRRSRVLAPLAATVTALSLVAAGCGGSDDPDTTGAAAAKAAGYVPSSAAAYVEVSTDFDGPQWTQIDTLGKVFPAYPQVRAELEESLSDSEVDFDTQVKPLLGGRAAIAVLTPPPSSGGMTAPDLGDVEEAVEDGEFLAVIELAEGKEADAEALIAKEADGAPQTIGSVKVYENDDSYSAVVPGAILISDDTADLQAGIDANAAGGDRTLAGSSRFTEAIGRLPEQTFATAYIDVGTIVQQQAAGNPNLQSQQGTVDMVKDTRIVSAAAAEPGGIRIKGVVVGGPESEVDASFTPSLTSNVPADALGYFGFSNLQGQVAEAVRLYGQAGGQQMIDQAASVTGQLQPLLGVSLDDLRALAAKEHAVVVTKGTPVPGASLLLQVDDGARATRTLDSLREKAPALLSQFSQGTQLPPWRQVPLERGVQGWDLPLSPQAGVTYGVDGNLAILGTNPATVRAVQAPTTPLAGSADFTEATAGMPDEVTSVVWVNMGEVVQYANSLGAFDDEPEAYANLQKIKSVSGWTTDGDEQTFEIFVRIG
jgi:hypothetical protein